MDIIVDLEKLSARSEELDTKKANAEMREIILALKKKVREDNLTSLSAPQLGFNKRLFVINFNGDIRTFINPIISNIKGFELSKETCSSIPDKTFIRPRHNDITAMYQTPLGKIETKRFVGMSAKVFQHEVDHLDGLLLTDVGLEVDSDYENASEEEKLEVINMYLDSLDIKHKEIEKEISEDADLKKLSDGIEFMTKLQKGEIQVEKTRLTPEEVIKDE